MDFKKMTRMQAERLVARTTHEDTLREIAQHGNTHVQKKANHKLAKLESEFLDAERAREEANRA
jgi:hypothetical protein